MEKAYIFDIISKIYLATDSNPSDSDAFGLCSDVIDTVIAFAGKFDHIVISKHYNLFDLQKSSRLRIYLHFPKILQ